MMLVSSTTCLFKVWLVTEFGKIPRAGCLSQTKLVCHKKLQLCGSSRITRQPGKIIRHKEQVLPSSLGVPEETGCLRDGVQMEFKSIIS